LIDIPTGTVKWFRTGSSYTCEPPVEDTDYDLVLYVRPLDFDEFQTGLASDGWERGGSRHAMEEWVSFKKRHTDGVLYNLIVTKDDDRYDRMYVATAVAKKLNLTNKEDRVMLFHAIVDNVVPFRLQGEDGTVTSWDDD
jgi:hypothetical protein